MASNRNVYQQANQRMLKYKKKSKRIKKLMKSMVFENSALRDQVAQIQDTIYSVKEERRFLLKKLMEFDSDIGIDLKPPATLINANVKTNSVNEGISQATNKSKNRTSSDSNKSIKHSKEATVAAVDNDGDAPKSVVRQQIVQTISVDHLGRPIYPINIGNELIVYDLGEISCDRPGYHSENWIYPIGFVATRVYGHMKEPDRKCTYTCKITDGGEFPRFEIIPEMDMEYAIAGPSPDLCHAVLLQTINCNSDARHIEVRPQGDWFFGLGHPAVMTLMQTLSNAADCENFVGFKMDTFDMDLQNDPTVNYEALQIYLGKSVYHMVPEIKEEPPEELFEQNDGPSFSIS